MNHPWFDFYDPSVPHHLHYPQMRIFDFLQAQATKNGCKTALICGDKQKTYQGLYTESLKFAGYLVENGLLPGDRVAICLPNRIEFVVAYFGTLLAGGIIAAMNPAYPLSEWRYQVDITRPRFILGEAERFTDLQVLRAEYKIDKVICTGRTTYTPSKGDCVIFEDLKDRHLGGNTLPEITHEHAALLQFSGGTTGAPKAALALHKNVVANILQFSRWLSNMKEGEETFLTVIPLFHVYGMVIGLNVGIAMGATIVLLPDSKDLGSLLKIVQDHKVTFLPGVPSLYQAIIRHPDVLNGKIDLRSIKACISGSAPLLPETRLQFESLSGAKLVEGYGLSEAPTATHCNPIGGENRLGSIGLPLPDVECKIVVPGEDDQALQPGETGELLIRGPQVMQGYFDNPEETQISLKGGWLHTGDMVRMDSDGYFYVVGRIKELIKVNGLQVWPAEVEKVLMKFRGVLDAAVAGVPDDMSGECVKAWLVTEDNYPLDLDALQEFCRRHLATYKIPRDIEFVEHLPRSAVGKVLRRKLVESHMKKRPGGL